LLLGTPAVLENVIGSLMHLVDALMLAQLENNVVYIAATLLTSVWFWRLAATTGCVQSGCAAYVARRWGEQRFRAAGLAVAHSLVLALAIGLVSAVILFIAAPWMMGALTGDRGGGGRGNELLPHHDVRISAADRHPGRGGVPARGGRHAHAAGTDGVCAGSERVLQLALDLWQLGLSTSWRWTARRSDRRWPG
jgi:hypothetical protein